MDDDESQQELHALLGESATFGALDPSARTTLAAVMRPELVAPGHMLLRQGELGAALAQVNSDLFTLERGCQVCAARMTQACDLQPVTHAPS